MLGQNVGMRFTNKLTPFLSALRCWLGFAPPPQPFQRLQRALPQHYVFPQVCLGALMDVATDQQRMKFAMKIADFVICQPDMSVVCIIEIDDQTHKPLKEKDMARDAMTRAAGHATLPHLDVKLGESI